MRNTPKKKNTASLSKRRSAGPRRANQFQLARPTLSALEGCPVTGKPALTIISASRRTDIPAFYMRWFMNRLREGYAAYPNPFSEQIHEVSLAPEDVHSIVFWSKNFAPFLPHMAELDGRGYRYYGHFTITDAPRDLEPHTPPWQRSADVFRQLAERTSPSHVQWRFDPILLTSETTPQDVADRFRHIASALEGYTRRCYVSFATLYRKAARRLAEQGIKVIDPPLAEKTALLADLSGIAADYGITLYACCQDALLGDGIHKARCVDGDLLAELFPDRPLVSEARPTRDQCGCVASRDIGVYDTCPLGCVYCYANRDHAAPVAAFRSHAPDRPALRG